MKLHEKMLWPEMSILYMFLTSALLEEMTSLMFGFVSRSHFVQGDSKYEILLF